MGRPQRVTGRQQPRGCVVRKTQFFVALIALCAMALFIGIAAVASAAGETETSTTTTTAAGGTTSTTAPGDSTTTTSTGGSTTTTTDVDWMSVTSIDWAETGMVPTFASLGNGLIAWTGRTPGAYSSMYVYNPANRSNTKIPEPFPGNYYNPSSDGSLVVFQGGRAGGYDDIYLYDTGNNTVRQLTHNSDPGDGNDWNPRIDGDYIVWEKHMQGAAAKTGVYLYDLNHGSVTRILEGDQYHDPDVSGEWVVCVKDAETGNGTELVLYNIKTKTVKTIAAATKNNQRPRIDAGHVVWSSGEVPTPLYYPWDTYQIVLYDVAADTYTPLTDNKFGNTNPSIKGNLIAWNQEEPSGMQVLDYVRNYKGIWNEGETLGAPEVDDGFTFVYFGGAKLYYATPLANGPLFIDVGQGDPYAKAINGLADKGVVQGYEDGFFGVYDPVTRQQFAKMILLTMAQWNPVVYTASLHDTCNFIDSDLIERSEGELYAYHYVAKASATGLTLGYRDGTFKPLNNISRQQVITMIVRAGQSVLVAPPADWQGVLSYVNKEHGERIRIAEYNGLLDGMVGGTWGGLSGWDTRLDASRGEVAQMLYNLLKKLVGTD